MRSFNLICLCLALAFTGVSQATIVPTLDQFVTNALKTDYWRSVYVGSGIPGTDSETAQTLFTQIDDGDHINIVMLPAGALDHFDGTRLQFAFRVMSELGGKQIMGLSIGDSVYGYSNALPAGVAANIMKESSSISDGTVETLLTFIQYTHAYQAANFIPPPKRRVSKTHPWAPIKWLLTMAILTITGAIVVLTKGRT